MVENTNFRCHKINEKTGIVYEIFNNITCKSYIGRSEYPVEYRFEQHIEKAYNPKSDVYNTPFMQSIREYGRDNFSIRVLATATYRDFKELNDIEQAYIRNYKTYYPYGYNTAINKGVKNG